MNQPALGAAETVLRGGRRPPGPVCPKAKDASSSSLIRRRRCNGGAAEGRITNSSSDFFFSCPPEHLSRRDTEYSANNRTLHLADERFQ